MHKIIFNSLNLLEGNVIFVICKLVKLKKNCKQITIEIIKLISIIIRRLLRSLSKT